MSEEKTLIAVENLRKFFPVKKSGLKKLYVQAVDNVTLTIKKGETLASVIGPDVVEVDVPLQDGDSLRSRICRKNRDSWFLPPRFTSAMAIPSSDTSRSSV